MTAVPLPMKAVPAETLPADDEHWAFEVKWDGYRVIAVVDTRARSVQLFSSRGNPADDRFGAALAGLWQGLHATTAVLDGEVVALDATGRPSFAALQQGTGALGYVVFDLLALDGHDLTGLAYTDRRRLLRAALDDGPTWRVGAWQAGGGPELWAATAEQGLEGVIAKRLDSRYEPGRRSAAWRKLKHVRRQELVVGGWLPGAGARSATFGALLVGVQPHRGGHGPLVFAGRVGTGFDERTLRELRGTLDALATDDCPFAPPLPAEVRRSGRWVRPELVVEVGFTEWTDDGVLRHPRFVGVRDDKDPADVVREAAPSG